jgi:uncharacterized membrane protein YfcA
MSYFFFFIATILAGTINALAGGGGLITFPLLMLVVAPVTADATSALALFFAYPGILGCAALNAYPHTDVNKTFRSESGHLQS